VVVAAAVMILRSTARTVLHVSWSFDIIMYARQGTTDTCSLYVITIFEKAQRHLQQCSQHKMQSINACIFMQLRCTVL
jgi:hypothetical protein